MVHDLREVKKATFQDTCDVWFRDLFVLTVADGRQCRSKKIKDLVISGGENTSRFEIEEFLPDRKNLDGRQIVEGYFPNGNEQSSKIPKSGKR